jgi:DNA-binding transcriptional MerR regulator
MGAYSIGQLARGAGVATSTVRFYERRGILSPMSRSAGNYRQYGDEAMERLRFIRTAQGMGFTLKDIDALLELTYATKQPCEEVLEIADKRLAEVRVKIAELAAMEKTLAAAIGKCCKGESPDLCGEIGKLRGEACDCGGCEPKKGTSRKSRCRA